MTADDRGGAARRVMTYADRLPNFLRTALVQGRWLPIVGAGMSATATTRTGGSPPGWSGLARALADDLPNPVGASPLDVISQYADAYGRPQLVERLGEILHVREIEPGPAHCAFVKLPFDIVVTTNIDYLLERAYEIEHRPYEPLVGESRLSVARSPDSTDLMKFHGDLRHPMELVVTEDDYDGFLRRNPLLATSLSSWLLTREAVFIGYSLDDADLREILALLRERLGRMVRRTWAVLAADPDKEAPKFERRGVRPIVLDDDPRADRADVLARFFGELRDIWEHEVEPKLVARTDVTTAELRRPAVAPQAALFVASPSVTALYRDYVFSSVLRTGLLPMAIDDVRPPDPAMRPMAVDIALSKAAVVVYDVSRQNPLPADYVVSRRGDDPPVLVRGTDPLPTVLLGREALDRPAELKEWPDRFVVPLQDRIRAAHDRVRPTPATITERMHRLHAEKKYEDFLLTGLALLEEWLRGKESEIPAFPRSGSRVELLRDQFQDNDYDTVITAVGHRHNRMQDFPVSDDDLAAFAPRLAGVLNRKFGMALDVG